MDFIDNLISLMRKRNINTSVLQKDIDIKESTFRGWKKGSQPTADKIITLAKYFDVSTDELLGLKKPLELTKNDKELLELFHSLSEREQIKLIGRVEELIKYYKGE